MTTLEPAPSAPGTRPAADAGAPGVSTRKRARITARAFRPRRTIPATIVATALAVVALLAGVEVVSRLAGRPARMLPVGWLTERAEETRWEDPLAFVVTGALAALGLLLVLIAVWPGRSRVVPLEVDAPALVAGITRRALRHDAAAAAREVPGITRAAATLRGHRLRVRAGTPLRDPGDLRAQVEQAVTTRLERLAPLRPVRVAVTVHHVQSGGLGG